MKEYMKNFFRIFDYPEDARENLLTAYQKIQDSAPAAEKFNGIVGEYETDRIEDFNLIWEPLDRTAEFAYLHIYTVHLLFFICCSRHLKELYEKNNLPESIWHDSMADLKWKLLECKKMHGLWGTFVGFWFPVFFKLMLFGIGRLEFEQVNVQEEYIGKQYSLHRGDSAINIHIPSSGPLKKEACMESFKQAYTFFKKLMPEEFGDKEVIPFVCGSWLLYKKHELFLPEASNIRGFMNFFEIHTSWEDNSYHDFWRIFYKNHNAKREELPCETSLQRAYLKWFDEGNLPGCGLGVFFFDGEKIIKQ